MSRSDRLFDILQILRDGELHRAADLAARLGVSVRTLYRDMERLADAGVPVQGSRGQGYRIADTIALPPLTLTEAELEALNLGIAIVAQSTDPALKAAARALADTLDAALPARGVAQAEEWKYAFSPLADSARGFSHMAGLRSAIRGRQKLRLRYLERDGTETIGTVRPLGLDYWARIWILTVWCETRAAFRELRVDLIEQVTPLPELFADDPGKRLEDFRR